MHQSSNNLLRKIALTGSSGFLGRKLLEDIRTKGIEAQIIPRELFENGLKWVDSENATIVNPTFLEGCCALIHTAGRAHVLHETSADPLAEYRKVNCHYSLALAKAAWDTGVKRFVFISSIGVCGVLSQPDSPSNPHQQASPEEPYAISKFEAEQKLLDFAKGRNLELIVIRPPLIHGSGAKGNLRSLLGAIAKGRPLPLGSVGNNRRSFLGIDNACSAIIRAATASFPQQQLQSDLPSNVRIYHLSDEGAISTRKLIEVLAEGMGIKPRLIPMPEWMAMTAALPLGKQGAVKRLFGSLEVDSSDFYRDFSWKPEVGLEDGLRSMARAWKERGGW